MLAYGGTLPNVAVGWLSFVSEMSARRSADLTEVLRSSPVCETVGYGRFLHYSVIMLFNAVYCDPLVL
jgi:hypothetical protein